MTNKYCSYAKKDNFRLLACRMFDDLLTSHEVGYTLVGRNANLLGCKKVADNNNKGGMLPC